MGGEEVPMEKRMRIGDETAILSLISLFNFEHSFFNRLSSKVANLPKIEWMALKFVFHLDYISPPVLVLCNTTEGWNSGCV